MRGENDNAGSAEGSFRPSALSLFLPTIVIVAGYASVLAALVAVGRGDGGLARLCLIVLGLGGPFLVAHALLRFHTIRLDVRPWALLAHPGFPRSRALEVPYALIAGVRTRQGLAGRVCGSATLIVDLVQGQPIVIAELARSEEAAAAIERQMSARSAQHRLEGGALAREMAVTQ